MTIYLSLHNTNTNLHRSKFLILLYTNFDPTLLHTRNKIKFCSSYFEVNCKLFFVLITDMSDNNLLLLLILWHHVRCQRKPLLLHQDYQEEEVSTDDDDLLLLPLLLSIEKKKKNSFIRVTGKCFTKHFPYANDD